MIKKAAAILVASIMAMMAVCCVGVSDADDPGAIPLLDMHFDDSTSSKQRTIAVNEGEYYGYSYTLKISVKDSTADGYGEPVFTRAVAAGSGPVDTPGPGAIIGNSTTTIVTTVVPGMFKLNVERDYNNTNNEYYDVNFIMNVKVEMIVSIGTVHKTMTPLLYSMNVTSSESESSHPVFQAMEFSVGTYANIQIQESTADNYEDVLSDIPLYHWYAEGLPDGLSLSENGFVSGIPTNSTETGGVNVTIYAFEHDNGKQYVGTLNVKVSEAVNTPTGFSYTVQGTGSPVSNCKNFVAVTNDTVTLTVTPSNGSVVVQSVNVNNEYSTLTNTNNVYTLNTDGTGCYKVLLTYTSNSENTTDVQYFHMYVIPSFNNVDAQIVISSS